MKKIDNSSSTEGSICEKRREATKISGNKLVTLLKFVYQEKKSIKQASRYLDINYNTAKRAIKNFRKKKISVSQLESREKEIKCNEDIRREEENSQSEVSAKPIKPCIHIEPIRPIQSQLTIKEYLINQLNILGNQLLCVNQEIAVNQQSLNILAMYVSEITRRQVIVQRQGVLYSN